MEEKSMRIKGQVYNRSCETCINWDLKELDEPCCSCRGYSDWTPKTLDTDIDNAPGVVDTKFSSKAWERIKDSVPHLDPPSTVPKPLPLFLVGELTYDSSKEFVSIKEVKVIRVTDKEVKVGCDINKGDDVFNFKKTPELLAQLEAIEKHSLKTLGGK